MLRCFGCFWKRKASTHSPLMKNITNQNKVFSNQGLDSQYFQHLNPERLVDASGLGKYCNTTHVLNVSLAVSIRSLAI